jgi:succinyl-CoA synthetase beta subunit
MCTLQWQAHAAVEALKVSGDKEAAAQQIKSLYDTFVKSDCTMVEVCPDFLRLLRPKNPRAGSAADRCLIF